MDAPLPSVLFVDDEENVLKSLKRLFLDEPFEVFTATSGDEGLEILRNREVAVIVSDQRMPQMTGAQFLEKAKRLSPYAIRMILTGYADVLAAMDAINRGSVWRYITKPWNDEELYIAIKNASEMYRITKENIYLTELTKKQNEELQKWSSELELYVQQQTIELTRQNQTLSSLNERLSNNIHSVISSFANLIEIRDKTVCNHSESVAALSSGMAQRILLPEDETRRISVAALLHDIGKIGIADIALLKNPNLLTDDERLEYQKHPLLGQAVVNFIEDFVDTGVLIRHHHEEFDGGGFPDGLKKDSIPLGSRIISLADTFDRLSVTGSGSFPMTKALEIVESSLGKRFDPDLFNVLKEVARETANTFVFGEGEVEVELAPQELLPGMTVSKDVHTGAGLVLMKRGIILTDRHIEMIKRCYHLDPAKTGIFVKVDRNKFTSSIE